MADLFCDICGRTPVRAQILLEGAKLLACGSCARSGKIIQRIDEEDGAPLVMGQSGSSTPGFDSGEDIVDGWGRIIREGRDRIHLPLSVVAERINEKESYLAHIESGQVSPSLEMARKLEKELKIRLIEKSLSSVSPSVASGGKYSPPTLADLLTSEKKKK